jgi:hypothetical protein
MAYISGISNIVRSEGDPKVLSTGRGSLGPSDRLARALGWFSLGLGLSELVAPQLITRSLGLDGKQSLIRAYGAREIGSGVLSLSTEKGMGLWSRIAGDFLDIATLMGALRRDNPKRSQARLALAMVAGVTVLDIVCAQGVSARHLRSGGDRRKYSDRTGFPQGVQKARGAAKNFTAPSTAAAE